MPDERTIELCRVAIQLELDWDEHVANATIALRIQQLAKLARQVREAEARDGGGG